MYGPLKYYGEEFVKNLGDRAKEVLSYIYPAVTMSEESGEILIEADLPGFDKKDIKVRLENNAVIISATRRIDPKGNVMLNQRPEKIYKRLRVPFEIDQSVDVNAKYSNGVLAVKVPAKGMKSVKID